MFFRFPPDAHWNSQRSVVEFGIGVGEYEGVLRASRRVYQILLAEASGRETTRSVSPRPIPSSKLPSFWVWNPGHVLPWKIHTMVSGRQPPRA
jgi:hypothetical protein